MHMLEHFNFAFVSVSLKVSKNIFAMQVPETGVSYAFDTPRKTPQSRRSYDIPQTHDDTALMLDLFGQPNHSAISPPNQAAQPMQRPGGLRQVSEGQEGIYR